MAFPRCGSAFFRMASFFVFFVLWWWASPARSQAPPRNCSVCGSGSILLPEALVSGATTCGEMQETLSSLPEGESCPGEGLMDDRVRPVCCRGNCICGEGDLVPDFVVPELPSELPPNTTCLDLQQLAGTRESCPEFAALREVCCTGLAVPPYVCSQQIRRNLLHEGYDTTAVPFRSFHEQVEVSVELEYQAVTDVNTAEGTVSIYAWLTLRWRDPRLAWEYDPVDNCTNLPVSVRASTGPGSEIWVPDLDLYNQGGGRLGDALAEVSPSGDVVWMRDGELRAICSLANLARMPFDELGCQFMFGAQNQFYGIGYKLEPATDGINGLKIGQFSSKYSEYRLVRAEAGQPNDVNQVLYYNFFFQRGTRFYTENILIPVAILSYLSIFTMILPLNEFQRLALNLTLMLVTVAQKISIYQLLPVTDESIWIVGYVALSFYWIVFTIAETGFVACLQYFRDVRQTPGGTENENDDDETGVEAERAPPGAKARARAPWLRPPEWCYTVSLKRIDITCFLLSVSAYTVFLVIMATSNESWGGDDTQNWINSDTGESFFV